MTLPMIIALAVTVLMIILIMVDKLPFGAPPLLALLLLVVFGVTDIKTAFGGFANPTIVMLASFMAIIAALQKTSFIVKFKQTMFNMASKGGFKAYVLLILIVMLGCSLFGTGSTAYYVLVIGLLSTLPYSKQLPPSKVLMPAGFAANHPLLPFNTALQYGIVIAVLQSAGVAANVNLVKFSLVNLCLSIGFLVWCILAYKIMPDHPIAEAKEEALHAGEQKVALTKNQELITYFSFVLAVVGMILQSKIGDAGYAITGLAVGVILISGVMDFNEIRNSISAPIILMSAGVIGIADALGNTGLTSLVGETVAKMLGTNVNPFVLIFAFCILTSLLATLTGSTIGTVYVFAPMAIATCVNLGLDPTAAAAAIVVSGWCGHFLPIDGMPAMIMGAGDYKITEFWKFTIPQYFIRLLALTVGAVLIFPRKYQEKHQMKNTFELEHVGINTDNAGEAEQLALLLCKLFNLEPRHGQKSEFAGNYFECMKSPFLGKNGHIAMRTPDLKAAMEELEENGFSFRMETAAYFEDGRIKNVYLDGEYGGFAIHIMQK